MSTAARLNSMNSAVEYRVSRVEGTLSGLFTSMQNPEQSPPSPTLFRPSCFSTKTFPDIQFAFSAPFSYYKKDKYTQKSGSYVPPSQACWYVRNLFLGIQNSTDPMFQFKCFRYPRKYVQFDKWRIWKIKGVILKNYINLDIKNLSILKLNVF